MFSLKICLVYLFSSLLWTDVYITERCPVPLKHFGRIWTMELTIMSWLFHHCATAASNSQRKLKFIILFIKFLQYFSITQNIEQASNMLTEFKFTEYYIIFNKECYNWPHGTQCRNYNRLHKFYPESHNSAIVISVITLIALTLLYLKGREGEVALAEFKVIRKNQTLR